MPCTNVVLRIAGLSVDEALFALAKKLAQENGVRVLDYVRVEGGALVGSGGYVLDAKRWVVAAAYVAEARRQGYRAALVVKDGKLVVTGVTQ